MKRLKKVLSVLTLVILIGSDFLTSFSYALDDMLEDSVVVQAETIEKDDDNNKRIESGEDTEDENTSDENDGENMDLTGEEESLENNETPENNENLENNEDLENDEDLENNEKAQTNIQDNEINNEESVGIETDLKNDVKDTNSTLNEEPKGIESELFEARKNLNDKVIEKSESYNEINVNVSAKEGTFPKGTYATIEPIKANKQLNEIKEQINESDFLSNISQSDEIVAFDIKFEYDLSNGSKVELQPLLGESVQVTFDYSDNKTFKKADDNQTIEVYHINDKNENGEKVEKGEETIEKIEINQAASAEVDNGLVIDAESFSIYVLVLSDDDTITLTLDPREGSIIDRADIVVNENGTGTIASTAGTVVLPGVTREGFVFSGWYTSSNEYAGISGTNYTVENSITLYAKYGCNSGYHLEDGVCTGNTKTVECTPVITPDPNVLTYTNTAEIKWDITLSGGEGGWPVIPECIASSCTGMSYLDSGRCLVYNDLQVYLIKSDGTTGHYTLMDRNIGATTNDITNTESRGYYYKWGNNHGFTTNDPKYFSTSQPVGYRYSWGQGPCPNGYYIPSDNEFSTIISDWESSKSKLADNKKGPTFGKDWLLSTAGYHNVVNYTIYSENAGYYWSSSSSGNSRAYNIYFSQYGLSQGTYDKGYGLSVRCFKNSQTQTLALHPDGGTGAVIAFTGTAGNGTFTTLDNPTRGIDRFDGWYSDSNYENIVEKGDLVTANLYAKWTRVFTVTFMDGGETLNLQPTTGLEGSKITLPEALEKSGYIFTGWYKESTFENKWNESTDTITGNTIIYAKYSCDTANHYVDDENGGCVLPTYTVTFMDREETLNLQPTTGAYGLTITLPEAPYKTGYIFDTWYKESTFENEWIESIDVVTGDTTLYAKYGCDTVKNYVEDGNGGCECNIGLTEVNGICLNNSNDSNTIISQFANEGRTFTYGEISISRPDSISTGPESYIIMDRNLGASSSGTVCDTGSNNGTCGLLYQYGNNYGFSYGNINMAEKCNEKSVDLRDYSPSNPYYDSTFIKGKRRCDNAGTDADWAAISNYNIWGGQNGNYTDRQGPCPNGWHIPTKKEWEDVVNYWTVGESDQGKGVLNSSNINDFRNYFKLPLAGERGRTAGSISQVGLQGNYDTTQPNNGAPFILRISTTGGIVNSTTNYNQVNGYSVRCFKNIDEDKYTVTFENRNGDVLWSTRVTSGETPVYSGIPSRPSSEESVYTFDKRYPEIGPVTTDITYTATFLESPRLYTITLTGTPTGYGTLSAESLSKEYGAAIIISGDKLTIGGTEIILTGNEGYEFQEWTGTCGNTEKYVCDEITVYNHPDPIEFTGSSNVTIPYYLFSESNYQKDFEISFDIIDQDLGNGVEQATILNVKDEDKNSYPGFTVRKAKGKEKIEFTARGNVGSSGSILYDYSGVHNVKISRINSILYVSVDGGNNKQLLNYSGFNNYFVKPITFGSSYTDSNHLFRPAKVTLSNILIKSVDTCYTGNVYVVTGDCQMTAKFTTENKYEITFMNEDGTQLQRGYMTAGEVPVYTGSTPEKQGTAQYSYTFSGWTDGENEYTSENLPTVQGAKVYTATYSSSINKYPIIWIDGNGNTLKIDQVAYGDTPNYTGSDPTKASTTQYTYTFNNNWDPEISTVTTGETYTAQFSSTLNKYTITIVSNDINSGTISTGSITSEYGTEITTSGNELKIGTSTIIASPSSGTAQYTYTFSGWISDCNENILTGNCTFTGIFDSSVNSYDVTGNVATGDNGKGYLSGMGNTGINLTGLYEYSTELIFIAIPELGYLFDYWEVNGGTGENLPGGATASGNQLTVIVDQILDIIAHFTENAKNVTINYYEMNTGGVYPNEPYVTDSLTGLVGEIKSINPESRIGFHLDNELSNTGVTISENIEDNIINIYYARDKHYITLGYSGAFVNPNSIEVTPALSESGYYYGENVHFEAIISTGYVFKQWRVNGNPIAGNADGVDFVIGTSDVILVIDGDPMNYRIDYYTEPGYSDPSNPNPDSYTILSGEIEINNPIAGSCYNFLGWTGGTTGDGILIPTTGLIIDSSKGGDREYYGNWERKSYEVTLSVDPLSGGTVTGAGIYRCMGTIELHATPNTGYHFVGWYDSIGNLISDNSMYVFYAPESDLGTGLTAKFEKNQYYITINKNGSGNFNGGSAHSGRYYHDTPIMFDVSPNFGYKIQKWTKNGHDITGVNNEIYTGSILNITVTETGDYEVYIIPETYNIIYIDGETILPLSPSSYTVENHVYLGDLPTITKDAYNFEGWYYENPVQQSNKVEELGEVPVNGKSVPIYAGWTPIDYNITYNLLSGETINWGEYYPYEFYQSYTVETSGTNLPTPQKSGYVFSGWMNHGEYISTFGGGMTGNLDLYPTWNSDVMDIEVRYHAMDTNGQYPGEWSGNHYTGLTESLFTVPDYTTSGFHYYNYVYNGYTGYENPASFIVSGNNSANVIDVYYERERYFIERSGRYYQMPDATYIDFVKITPDNQPYYQYYYGEEIKIESIHPAYGWIFSGWYDATSEGKGFPSDEVSLDSRNFTFHMPAHNVWVEPIMYHIPYILSFTGYEGAEITNLESCSYGTGDRETYYDYSECLPNLNKAGYWFNGWDDENGIWVRRLNDYSQEPILHRMPAHDYKLVANFEPRNNMSYEKYYYLQDVEGTGYTLSGELTDFGNDGVTDQEMPERNPSYNIDGFQYSGFGYSGVMLPWEQRPYIKATGENYINYYYDRKTYLVDVDYDNKKLSIAGTGEYRYEAPVTLTATVNTGYEFSGFTSDNGELLSSGSVYNFTMPDSFVDIYADANPIEYSIEYELDGGRYNPSWYENSTTYTIENPNILLLNPEKDGYTFLGWTGGVISGGIEGEENIVVPTRDLIITGGSIGDRKYYANWESDEVKVTVNYYLKKIDPKNNVLTGGVDEYLIGVVYTGLTDSGVDIRSLYGTGIEGYEYTTAIVYGSDLSGGVETGTTTILGDGSRSIDIYYTPNKYNFTLNSDSYSSTDGSSESTGYYFGATVRLSGDSNNDCFTWSGWTTSGITLSDDTLQQTSFTMPSNNVSVSPSVREKTYNIIFSGNGNTSGEMSPINGIRCTGSTGLILNNFERDGYTFTGWSTTSGLNSREYTDGQTVTELSKNDGENVNLYAVWDVNWYTVTFDLRGGSLTGNMTLTTGYTVETSAISLENYIPVKMGHNFSGWYKGNNLVNSIAGGEVGNYTLTAKWEAIPYTVSFDSASGTIVENQTYYYSDVLSDLDNAITTRTGYNFSGWYLSGVLYTSESTMPAENITLTAKWTPKTGTQYQVNHRGENIAGTEYDVVLSGYTMYGTSDSQTIAESGDFAGFTLSGNVNQKIIEPEGTTVIDIYYSRNVYSIILDNNGGTGVTEFTGKYQAPLIVPNPSKSGYEFAGWNPELPTIIPDYDYTGIAMWNPSTGEYKVEFYYQLSNGTYPSIATSGDLRIGMTEGTGSVTDADKKPTMSGYAFDSTNTENILEREIVGDGSLVLKVYFKKQFTVRYLTGSHGTFSEDIHSDLDYGAGTPTFRGNTGSHDSGYRFIGWDPEIAETVVGDADYTAQWVEESDILYSVEYYKQNLSGGYDILTGTYSGKTNEKVTALVKDFTGFTFSGGNENNITSGVIAGDGSLVLKLFYDRNKYTITWKDGNSETLKSEQFFYGETPTYTGATPTKTATAQYTYTFNYTWTPNIENVTTGATYTAQFESSINSYSVNIVSNNTNMGTISTGEINVEYGSNIVENGNKITIGGVEIEAIPNNADVQYTYEFDNWTNTCGLELVGTCTIQANFKKTLNKYTITWKDDDGNIIDTTMVEYGVVPTHTTPTKPETEDYKYTFAGWTPELKGVVGNTEYTAVFNAQKKEKHSEGGGMSGGGGRRSKINHSDNQHGSAEEKSDLFNGDNNANTGDTNNLTLSLYQRARENNITTMNTLEEADPDGLLTRGHMAKMVVNFAQNVLGRTIPTTYPDSCNWKDKESQRESPEIKEYAKKACALGLMGIYVEEFMPNKILDRAEFGTTISRLLWGDKYNVIDTDHRSYYEDHLRLLKKNGILIQTNEAEDRLEIRKWVWLVFRRISEKFKK